MVTLQRIILVLTKSGEKIKNSFYIAVEIVNSITIPHNLDINGSFLRSKLLWFGNRFDFDMKLLCRCWIVDASRIIEIANHVVFFLLLILSKRAQTSLSETTSIVVVPVFWRVITKQLPANRWCSAARNSLVHRVNIRDGRENWKTLQPVDDFFAFHSNI